MADFNIYIDYRAAMMARLIQSAGLGFLLVPINTMAFSFVAREKMNNATGLMNLARNIGGSSRIAIVTTMLARREQFHEQSLVAHLTPYDAGLTQTLKRTTHFLTTQGASPAQAAAQAQGLIYGML
jgi:MFS transporter, DHA2 family, multidrug resistance protein